MKRIILALFFTITCFVPSCISDDYDYFPDPRSNSQGFRSVINDVEVFGYNPYHYTRKAVLQYSVADTTNNYNPEGAKFCLHFYTEMGKFVLPDSTCLESFAFYLYSDSPIETNKRYTFSTENRYCNADDEDKRRFYRYVNLSVTFMDDTDHKLPGRPLGSTTLYNFQGEGWLEIEMWNERALLRCEFMFSAPLVNREYHMKDGYLLYYITNIDPFDNSLFVNLPAG